MTKYRISWIDEVHRYQDIEAKNRKEAKKKFFDGECEDYSDSESNFVEDSLEIDKNV